MTEIIIILPGSIRTSGSPIVWLLLLGYADAMQLLTVFLVQIVGIATIVMITRLLLRKIEKSSTKRNLGPGKDSAKWWQYWPQICTAAFGLSMLVLIVSDGFTSTHISSVLQHIQRLDDAIFYNPEPGIYIVSFLLGFSAFLLIIGVGCLLMLLLPKHLQHYNGITPRDALLVFAGMLVFIVLLLPGIFLGYRAHRVSVTDKIISNEPISAHSLQFEGSNKIARAEMHCIFRKHRGHTWLSAEILLTATNGKTYPLITTHDGGSPLPLTLVTTEALQRLRSWLNAQRIPTVVSLDDGCSSQAQLLSEAGQAQYNLLFTGPSGQFPSH